METTQAITYVPTKAERTLLRCSFAHNDALTSRHFGSFDSNVMCRHCNSASETIDHLFLQRTTLKEERKKLRDAIDANNVISNPTRFLRLALLDRRFAIHAQRFITTALPHKGPGDPLTAKASDPTD